MAEDGRKAWFRDALRGTTDPVWVAIVAETPDMKPRPRGPTEVPGRRNVAPRLASADASERCFFARLAGSRRKVAVRCEYCDGRAARWCRECQGGKVMVETLHPADAWTLARLAEIPPMVTGARP